MEIKIKNIFRTAICFGFVIILAMQIASAGTMSLSTYQAPPMSFSSYYSSGDLKDIWPSLADPATCKARQDILLQVAPFGCQPMVVRSDLLAEQNVPVLCQIMGVQLNPLIDIKNIRNIRFKGNYPKEVSGVGFHPARAALLSRNELTGSPLINNIGYVVVVLKRNPKEAELPKFVNVTLTAQVDYVADNALGIGRTEFLLKEQSDVQWQEEKYQQSFWDGKYAVKLETADDNSATISLHHNQQKISTITVDKNKPAREIYLPGSYCQIALQVYYDGFTSSDTRAVVEISDEGGVDKLILYKGSNFLNDKCSVRDIKFANSTVGGFGSAEITCGSEKFTLLKVPKAFEYNMGQEVIAKIQIDSKDTATKDAKITGVLEGGKYEVTYMLNGVQKSAQVDYANLSPKISEGGKADFLQNAEIADQDAKEKLKIAIDAYNKVAYDYPLKEPGDKSEAGYGEKALIDAIKLAEDLKQLKTAYELKSKYLELYPAGLEAFRYQEGIKQSYNTDSSGAVRNIVVDNKERTIRLLTVEEPKEKPSADLIISTEKSSVAQKSNVRIGGSLAIGASSVMERIDADSARISYKCQEKDSLSSQQITVGDSKTICDKIVKVERINTEKLARIRIVPEAKGAELETNISVSIGIEKRAIHLSTDKKKDMIKNLNESIKKWEEISERLGKVVKGLKTACLATSGVLTLKNFLSGLSGETIARQEVMNGPNGWKTICKNEVANGTYKTQSACYNANSDKINSDIEATKNSIKKVDENIESVEEGLTTTPSGISGIIGESSVNTAEAKKRLAARIISDHGNDYINLPEGSLWKGQKGQTTVNVSELFAAQNLDSMTYAEMRNIYMNLERQQTGGLSTQQTTNTGSVLGADASRISDKIYSTNQYMESKKRTTGGVPDAGEPLNKEGTSRIYREVVNKNTLSVKWIDTTAYSNFAAIYASGGGKLEGGKYLLALDEGDGAGNYVIKEIYKETPAAADGTITYTKANLADFSADYKVGIVTDQKTISYNNKITNAQPRYYTTAPYDGMPAVVPFDVSNGWYAGTRQTLPAFGGIGAYDASGRVTSVWVCNVGKNGRIEFDEGFGDDICTMVNLQTGQPTNKLPGLDEAQSKRKVEQAIDAVMQAERQSGNKIITINGQKFEVGRPMANVPETQCEDFMSIGDCNLLFNVCDPVICPPSRCNLGGTYYVPDVIQSGIIGSVLLCLPNFGDPSEGKVLIPLCLTGIQAGLDAYVSLLKNHRDCLQESIDKGTMSGLCDQIYSVYLCKFFWEQIGPFLNNLIPKMFELLMGKTTPRGGGEYATVAAAWQNAENSFKYFTQTYGVNSFQAFQTGSIAEFGGEFCSAYVSATGPKKLESLIEPDSPPQYEAWFEAIPYSSATVPATVQYKVFYHIFAGKGAQGVYYSVYLKGAPESAYYVYSPSIQVPRAAGFIKQGEYASQTIDFTAPEGYEKLCININGDEECNFKQVSTSFAVNYLRDKYVQGQIEKTDIASEEGCISGSANEGALLANTNPLSAAQEAALPADYKRGIIRICSTNNPGSSTDPTRFVEVGNCGDQKIKCWLDKKSVDNAITPYAAGIRNETLQKLEANVASAPDVQATTVTIDSEIKAKFDKYMTLEGIKEIKGMSASDVAELLGRIDVAMDTAILNRQKAQLLYIKARIFDQVARKACGEGLECTRGAVTGAGAAAVPSAGNECKSIGGVCTLEACIGEDNLGTRDCVSPEKCCHLSLRNVYMLSDNYDLTKQIKVQLNGKYIGIWMSSGKVYYGYSFTYEDTEIGIISNNKINLLSGARTNIMDYYNDLNGAIISGTTITPASA